jgi:hypothetical protein|tara:strand:- start:528 stop:857 length:330 start_codon:yes stop_codon:yes gene_type:complete
MIIVNLLVAAELSESPTEHLSFRHLTYKAKVDLLMGVLIEVDQEMKDSYWLYLRRTGMLDFIEQMVTPEEKEDGIRVSTFNSSYPKTILTSSIRIENQRKILAQIEMYM